MTHFCLMIRRNSTNHAGSLKVQKNQTLFTSKKKETKKKKKNPVSLSKDLQDYPKSIFIPQLDTDT